MVRAHIREPPAHGRRIRDRERLGEVGELATMRHFDIADRDRGRFTFIGTAAVITSMLELNASAGVGQDTHPR